MQKAGTLYQLATLPYSWHPSRPCFLLCPGDTLNFGFHIALWRLMNLLHQRTSRQDTPPGGSRNLLPSLTRRLPCLPLTMRLCGCVVKQWSDRTEVSLKKEVVGEGGGGGEFVNCLPVGKSFVFIRGIETLN